MEKEQINFDALITDKSALSFIILLNIINYNNSYWNEHYKFTKSRLPIYKLIYKEDDKSDIFLILDLFQEFVSEQEIVKIYPHLLKKINTNPPKINYEKLNATIDRLYNLFCDYSRSKPILKAPVLKKQSLLDLSLRDIFLRFKGFLLKKFYNLKDTILFKE